MTGDPFEIVDVVTRIERRVVAKGSKSERSAIVAVVDDRPLVLRRRGEPAFTEDDELARFVGRDVHLHGTPLSTTFLVDDVHPVHGSRRGKGPTP